MFLGTSRIYVLYSLWILINVGIIVVFTFVLSREWLKHFRGESNMQTYSCHMKEHGAKVIFKNIISLTICITKVSNPGGFTCGLALLREQMKHLRRESSMKIYLCHCERTKRKVKYHFLNYRPHARMMVIVF